MATAYTPGLTVSPRTVVRRLRRLPIKGSVLVQSGSAVAPETVVAQALLPGIMQSVKAASILGVDAGEIEKALLVKVGDKVARDQVIAQTTSFFGMFKSDCKSPITGTVELISHAQGSVGIRIPPTTVAMTAYIQGVVTDVLADEGVWVETEAALIQGIFGIGGERTGAIVMVSNSSDDVLDADDITPAMAGKIVVGGATVTGAALRKASDVGVTGIVVGGIVDTDLVSFLGYDIGVAITGHEKINITLVITEGFGHIPMAHRTFQLLSSLAGKPASINGATQIRAGVIRPELIVPLTEPAAQLIQTREPSALEVGVSIRMIREPYFGILGTVSSLPSQLVTVNSGAVVRVLEATLADGRTVTVPRANVEIIETV